MAYVTPYTFVALQTLTAAQLNAIQTNITALWPYTAAGDISYASAAGVLARLAKGTANQILKMKSDASIPEWAEIAKNYVRVGRNSLQTLGNGSYVDISFNVEYQDTAGMWDAGSPTIFTVGKAGVYLIGCTIIFATNATGVRQTKLIVKRGGSSVDGTLVDTRSALTGVSVNVNLCAIAVLEVGDTINVEVWQNSGGDLASVATSKMFALEL